jgi:hypothetical protein
MSLNRKAVRTRVVFILLMIATLGLILMPRASAADHDNIMLRRIAGLSLPAG